MSEQKKRKQAVRSGNRAIVIGSGMAGLLSARILVEHFDNVTLIERDSFPEKPEARQGVPQAQHIHVLLSKGQQILEDLFPGIELELTNAGCPKIDWVKDTFYLHTRGKALNSPSEVTSHSCSRAFLEWLVRQRLTSYENLQFLAATQVKGLLSDTSNSKVTGVEVRYINNQQEAELIADLVVDATGRNSQLPKWFEKIGYQPPDETVINSFLGYSTRWYEAPENLQTDWKALVLTSKPPYDKRGGVLYPVEGNRWAVLLSGIAKDYPPNDESGFMEFARSLRIPEIYDFIKNAKPISPIYSYRRTENSWRHYEKLSCFPDGIVAIGDAVCAFNPVYGQGMTTAALSALTLNRCLHKQFKDNQNNLKGFSKRFQKELVQVLQTPWLMAKSEDFRWETTVGGELDKITQIMHLYMDEIAELSLIYPDIQHKFCQVVHMLKPSTSLFAPEIMVRVLAGVVKSRFNLAISPTNPLKFG